MIQSTYMTRIESGLRELFLKAYANVPLAARKEIILVLENEPVTWDVAYLEVKNDTEAGEKILKIVQTLGILKP